LCVLGVHAQLLFGGSQSRQIEADTEEVAGEGSAAGKSFRER
jgi:hypothetical protein